MFILHAGQQDCFLVSMRGHFPRAADPAMFSDDGARAGARHRL
jgi:hypothetical protein